MLARLNNILFIPPRTVFVVNAILFAFIFIIVIVFGYVSDKLADVTKVFYASDVSFSTTIFLVVGGLMVTDATIYAKTKKYFLCWQQCLNASVGTSVVVTVFYACIWSLIQVAKNAQNFVVFQPQFWSLQVTLNNLKYGALLFLFSSISLVSSLALVSEPGYDFRPFLIDWKIWRGLIQKLANHGGLSNDDEYAALLKSTQGMLDQSASIEGADHVQPISLDSVRQLKPSLTEFKKWYLFKTNPGTGNLVRIDTGIMSDVQRISALCGNSSKVGK
jgi:hypothetical protein